MAGPLLGAQELLLFCETSCRYLLSTLKLFSDGFLLITRRLDLLANGCGDGDGDGDLMTILARLDAVFRVRLLVSVMEPSIEMGRILLRRPVGGRTVVGGCTSMMYE